MKTKKNIDGYERLKIGSNIRKWRTLKDIKQKDLAESLKLSEAAISNLENDLTDITLSQLEDISLAIDVPVETLFLDPQEQMQLKAGQSTKSDVVGTAMDTSLVYALIGSIQRKDEQLKEVMERMLTHIDKPSKSRAVSPF
jgi:transcriptional regulator with XRE-family HTH domain